MHMPTPMTAPFDDLLVEHLPVASPSLRVAVVTETYPPEVNGVALTLQQLVQRLQALQAAVEPGRTAHGGDGGVGMARRDDGMLFPFRHGDRKGGYNKRLQRNTQWYSLIHVSRGNHGY